MKYWLIAIAASLSFYLISCKGRNDKPAQEEKNLRDSLAGRKDTFLTVALPESPSYIQPGIVIDSASFRAWGAKVSLYYRLPDLSKKEFPRAVKWMYGVLNEKQASYMRTQKEPDIDVFDEFLGTKLFYKDNRILSIVLDEWITDGMHRSVWSHHSFNYDIIKAKEISIADYFILQSMADTVFMNDFLKRSIGIQNDSEFDIRKFGDMRDINFSFAVDSANVYFFFDRYGLYGIGDRITIVPKKYIAEHIRPEYR